MKNLSKFFVYLLVTFLFTQCKEPIFDEPISARMLENSKARLETKNTDSDSVLVLGKKLENPYSGESLKCGANFPDD
jgi:hypothetical protein